MKRIFSIAFLVLFVATCVFADSDPKLSQNYPNPAKGKTYVQVEFDSPEAKLTLSSILGEIIQVQKLPYSGTFTIDVTNIPDGVYFYTLETDGQKLTKRLTVKK